MKKSNKEEKKYCILITGIGCLGKSMVRRRVAEKHPTNVVIMDLEIDFGHAHEPIKDANRIVITESVHGLEDGYFPKKYDKIIYLLPPKDYLSQWLRRIWVWFSKGTINLSNPIGKNKRYAISNIPPIVKIILRNLRHCGQWIKKDLDIIALKNLNERTEITSNIEREFDAVDNLIEEIIKKSIYEEKRKICVESVESMVTPIRT